MYIVSNSNDDVVEQRTNVLKKNNLVFLSTSLFFRQFTMTHDKATIIPIGIYRVIHQIKFFFRENICKNTCFYLMH